MKTKILPFLLVSLMILSSVAEAGAPFKVNNREVAEGALLSFFKDDLDAGRITFSIEAEPDVASAEISLDNGRRWEPMERDGNVFVYSYRPAEDEKMDIVFSLKKQSGMASLRSTNAVILYQKSQPDDAIMLLLDRMKNAYEAEQKDRFVNCFSPRFPNRITFEESIQNDFYNYNNIRLFYRIDRRANDPDYQGAIWNVYWERRYLNRTGVSYNDSANISMRFDKEFGEWLITGMNGNTIFGSATLASPDLTISSSDISGGYVGPNYVVNAVVHNNGEAAAGSFRVDFYYPNAATLNGSETVTGVNANSQVTVSHSLGAIVPVAGEVFRVVIDPLRAVSEDNENNNEASKTFPI